MPVVDMTTSCTGWTDAQRGELLCCRCPETNGRDREDSTKAAAGGSTEMKSAVSKSAVSVHDLERLGSVPVAQPREFGRLAPRRAALLATAEPSDSAAGFGRVMRLPRISAARRSDSPTQAAYMRSVVAPPPPWPSRPATVRRSTPAVRGSVAE
jgi:hypothetical protein